MKNSMKSQGIFTLIFAITFLWGGAAFGGISEIGDVLVRVPVVAIVTLVALVYFIVKAKKKLLAMIVDVVAIGMGLARLLNEVPRYMEKADKYTNDKLSFYVAESFLFSLATILLVVTAVMLVLFIVSAVKAGVTKTTSKGFFKKEVECAICGRTTGLNRYKIGTTTDGKDLWKCPECARKGGLLDIDYTTGKVTLIENKDTETRMKCNACGHIYCYTLEDLQRNEKLAKGAVMDSLLGVGEAVGGTRIGSQIATAKADSKMNQIVDYTKCPHCHSTDVFALSKDEWETEKATKTQGNVAPVSSADELKKFKELLDMGVISQEEFDAKKKQLLGL